MRFLIPLATLALLAIAAPAAAQSVDLFVVFKGDVADSFWGSQAACNSMAATAPDLSCHQGVIAKPPAVMQGWTWTTADGWAAPGPTLTDAERVQDAARALHEAFAQWRIDLDAAGRFAADATRAVAHEFFWRAEQGAALVMQDATYTVEQRIEWARQSALGPSNAADAETVLRLIENAGLPSPISYVAFSRFFNGAVERCELAASASALCPGPVGLAISADPAPAGIDTAGSWVEDISG